jgi:hypothetical protein
MCTPFPPRANQPYYDMARAFIYKCYLMIIAFAHSLFRKMRPLLFGEGQKF